MPPEPKRVRVSIDLEDDLAAAFLEELGKRVATGSSSSKGDLGRILLAESLRERGYDLEPPEISKWGGHRQRQDEAEESGELAAYAAN